MQGLRIRIRILSSILGTSGHRRNTERVVPGRSLRQDLSPPSRGHNNDEQNKRDNGQEYDSDKYYDFSSYSQNEFDKLDQDECHDLQSKHYYTVKYKIWYHLVSISKLDDLQADHFVFGNISINELRRKKHHYGTVMPVQHAVHHPAERDVIRHTFSAVPGLSVQFDLSGFGKSATVDTDWYGPYLSFSPGSTNAGRRAVCSVLQVAATNLLKCTFPDGRYGDLNQFSKPHHDSFLHVGTRYLSNAMGVFAAIDVLVTFQPVAAVTTTSSATVSITPSTTASTTASTTTSVSAPLPTLADRENGIKGPSFADAGLSDVIPEWTASSAYLGDTPGLAESYDDDTNHVTLKSTAGSSAGAGSTASLSQPVSYAPSSGVVFGWEYVL
ncbi:hypothetical protein TI39_contig4329g00002 [Zymoseptoria brevis]|uniref:Uncharacterized protein n=1 Tax=Zymoseptoria brevis TaxID=1047168 RepID=A0A0F4G8M7_9PEZI|nr:hypothetical protein TI39_contig4329g00002 [Zymoseptoria brevis]